MDTIKCFICEKTNHISDGQVIVVATFAQKFHAKNAFSAIEKAHIISVWSCIFACEEILEKKFSDLQTLVIQLHGIKDIIHLQSLYIESICKENLSLTVDIISSKNSCETFLQRLQN